MCDVVFFFSSRRRHTRFDCDWSSDVCSSDLETPLFDEYDVEAEIRALFKARVELPTGGYLVIQATHGLICIDVNPGRYTGKKYTESTIVKTNPEAARQVATQMRLRDIRGIIVVDFIGTA